MKNKMGVYVLVAHLIITLAVLAIYAIFAGMGHQLTTIENMLLVIIGYWFGAVGGNATGKKVDQAQADEELKQKMMK